MTALNQKLFLSQGIECLLQSSSNRVINFAANGISSELHINHKSNKIETVFLNHNDIQGKLPSVFYSEFKTLDFSHNRISGSIKDMCSPLIGACNSRNSIAFSFNLNAN